MIEATIIGCRIVFTDFDRNFVEFSSIIMDTTSPLDDIGGPSGNSTNVIDGAAVIGDRLVQLGAKSEANRIHKSCSGLLISNF